MTAKLVFESVNEYVSQNDDRWANSELDRWDMKQKGQDPLKTYIKNVVNGIYNQMEDDVIRYTGVTDYIIEDIITAGEDDILTMTVYDYYNEHKPEETAIMELGLQIENYMASEGMAE